MFGPLLEIAMSKQCTPLWREAHFEVKMHKAHHSRYFWKLRCRKSARRCGAKHISKSKCTKHTILATFGSWDVEKVHAVVARSTFRSQNAQSTPASDRFWKLRCRKSARRCGAKHISKSKCTKHRMFGPLLEIAMSKQCTPLWREAHFEVKMHKAHHSRYFWKLRCRKSARRCGAKHISKSKCTKHTILATFGSWDVEKVHAVVARSTFRSQNAQSTPASDRFWKLRCRKSARPCGAKHMSKSKCTKHTSFGPLLEVEMSKKCTPLWREAHFEVKMYKAPHVGATFGGSDVVSRGRRKGLCTFSKVSKTWGFCGIFKNDGRRGTYEEDLQRCIFRGRRSTRDMFIRAVRRSGRWFPERLSVLEPQIFRFAEMILRDRRSTSYDLASLFRGRRSSLDTWSGKIAKRIGTRPSALHSTFHFWRKSRRIASFLMLSTSKIEEVSQTCFVFHVVKFKNWGSLAEVSRFWCCQVWKMKKSRRIASSSSSNIEEVSQTCSVFDVVKFKTWGRLAE